MNKFIINFSTNKGETKHKITMVKQLFHDNFCVSSPFSLVKNDRERKNTT